MEFWNMISRTKIATIVGLSVALVGASVALAQKDSKEPKGAKLNEKAPAFTLKDTKGVEHRLADHAGKIVVLEWFNPDCPYCRGVYENGIVAKTIKDLKAIDPNVVYMAVNSTAMGMGGPVSAEDVSKQSEDFIKKNKLEIPVLIDHDGTVGRLYGARTTPHMFVIDAEGKLRYEGAFTDDSSTKKAEYMNYVVNAVKQVHAKETVSPESTKSWGCSVKYAKKDRADSKDKRPDKGGKKKD
jgi:peroxiredoxin